MKINIDFYTSYEEEKNIAKYEAFLENYQDKIDNLVKIALNLHGIDNLHNVYIGIGVVPKEEIRAINNEHRQIDKETDVLSFPIYTKEEIDDLKNKNVEEDISLGDLILCMDVIEEHSIEYNTGLDREMLYMITHGVCHLLGFDHEIAEEKAVMRMREEEILKNI